MSDRFMAEALELARRGLGRVSPNPMVGAVLVKGSRIVGRGWHRKFGGPHAEVEAIRNAGRAASGTTLYVTMEPCCFQGKTPACTGAVESAGIRKVVAATLDPNPRVNGSGVKLLRECGIRTEVGLMAHEARRLNEAYFTFMRGRRPFVILKVAATLDGMMATESGESHWITGPAARKLGHRLREQADAIVVGINTVARDDPQLTCRTMRGKKLHRVVLDPDGMMPSKARMLAEPGPVLVFRRRGVEGSRGRGVEREQRAEGEGEEYEDVAARADRRGYLNWHDVLAELYRRRLVTVLVEGGAEVASTALASGVVDKVCLFQTPAIMGPGRSFSSTMLPTGLAQVLRLQRVERRCLGPDMLVEGYVHRAH